MTRQTPTEKARSAVVTALKALGWSEDPNGHLRGTKAGKAYRIKMQDISLRVEVRIVVGGQNEWRRIGGAYFRSCVVLEDGRVRIGTSVLDKLPPQ